MLQLTRFDGSLFPRFVLRFSIFERQLILCVRLYLTVRPATMLPTADLSSAAYVLITPSLCDLTNSYRSVEMEVQQPTQPLEPPPQQIRTREHQSGSSNPLPSPPSHKSTNRIRIAPILYNPFDRHSLVTCTTPRIISYYYYGLTRSSYPISLAVPSTSL